MSDIFENIWVIKPDGFCYYHKNFDNSNSEMNEKHFSGFITAILTFTRDVFKDTSNKLTLKGMDIFIKVFTDYYIVSSCKKGVKDEKKIYKLMEEVGKSFHDQYFAFLKNKFQTQSEFENFRLPDSLV